MLGARGSLRALRGAAVLVLAGALAAGPLSAQAVDPAPLGARLLAEPASTGVMVSVSNMYGMYGLATDGTLVYMMRPDGNIVTTPLAAVPLTPGSSFAATGTVHTVGWLDPSAPAWPVNLPQLSIVYSHGCLFMTNGVNTEVGARLYCISVADWSVTELTLPVAAPLPVGANYIYANLIDLPDGRIGKVSAYSSVSGGYESTLRMYTLSGTGAAVTLEFSEDFTMFDTENFAIDEHGIASDGNYIYRIQYRSFDPNFKSWQLASGVTTNVVFTGTFSEPFGNMHFLAHNHLAGYYLVGNHSSQDFYITGAVAADAGPGNGLTPQFAAPAATSGGCSVQVSNYDSAFTWGVTSTAGSAVISGTGLVTVTGAPAGSISITASTNQTGLVQHDATVACLAGASLAATGSEPLLPAAVAILLLAFGIALVVRRRRVT